MPLPFKYPPVSPDNHAMALLLLIRLVHLERKSLKDPKYKEDYVKFMNEVVSRGDAEEAPVLAQEEGYKWYIPHHGVCHPKKNKIRVVFDCSVRFKGTSLNDHPLSGPDLTTNLVGVLCRFRRYPYAIISDVEKMFHQFLCVKTTEIICVFFGGPIAMLRKSPRRPMNYTHLLTQACLVWTMLPI